MTAALRFSQSPAAAAPRCCSNAVLRTYVSHTWAADRALGATLGRSRIDGGCISPTRHIHPILSFVSAKLSFSFRSICALQCVLSEVVNLWPSKLHTSHISDPPQHQSRTLDRHSASSTTAIPTQPLHVQHIHGMHAHASIHLPGAGEPSPAERYPATATRIGNAALSSCCNCAPCTHEANRTRHVVQDPAKASVCPCTGVCSRRHGNLLLEEQREGGAPAEGLLGHSTQ